MWVVHGSEGRVGGEEEMWSRMKRRRRRREVGSERCWRCRSARSTVPGRIERRIWWKRGVLRERVSKKCNTHRPQRDARTGG
jgi:hypothetical protein